jgi:hypothetical protein
MTLRRLNLRIQGLPESYVTEPYGVDNVGSEPHHSAPLLQEDLIEQEHQQQQQQRMPPDDAPMSHEIGVGDDPVEDSSSAAPNEVMHEV